MKHRLILVIPIFFILISCSVETNLHSDKEMVIKGASPALSYEIESSSYSKNNISISYPKLVNLKNDTKEKEINELIQAEAIRINDFHSLDNTSLEVDYQITYKSDEFLSIQYSGSALSKGAAYPLNMFYTTNIDLDKEIKVKLSDLMKIDKALVQALKNGIYKSYDDNLNLQDEGVLKEIWSGIKDEDLLGDLKYSDKMDASNNSGIFSYLTPDSLGISLSVPHALGDHLEMEIDYGELLYLGDMLEETIDLLIQVPNSTS